MLILLTTLAALAGYGDPANGHPRQADRELLVWTNAARIAPTAWEADYTAGECSSADFKADERLPRPPLLWNHDLGTAARAHNDDMVDNNWFDHDSSDGTPFDARLWSYYDGTAIGENIAWGYTSSRQAVLSGWMCSGGHRANLTADLFDEVGVAARERVYTQDFGRGGVGTRTIASAVHTPENPGSSARILSDLWTDGAAVERFEAVVNGEVVPLQLLGGAEGAGLYETSVPTDGSCTTWYVEAALADGSTVRWPEDGAYGWGSCEWDDPATRWMASQIEPSDDTGDTGDSGDTGDTGDTDTPDPDDTGIADDNGTYEPPAPNTAGCSSVSAPAMGLFLLPLLALMGRRRLD